MSNDTISSSSSSSSQETLLAFCHIHHSADHHQLSPPHPIPTIIIITTTTSPPPPCSYSRSCFDDLVAEDIRVICWLCMVTIDGLAVVHQTALIWIIFWV